MTANGHTPDPFSVFSSLINHQRRDGERFYLVVVPDGEAPTVEEYTDVAELAERVRELDGEPVSVFAFLGTRFHFSRGPYRYLLTPFGNMPLFDLPRAEELGVIEDGYLGEEQEELAVPQLPPEETQTEEGAEDGEQDEDADDLEGEEVLGGP